MNAAASETRFCEDCRYFNRGYGSSCGSGKCHHKLSRWTREGEPPFRRDKEREHHTASTMRRGLCGPDAALFREKPGGSFLDRHVAPRIGTGIFMCFLAAIVVLVRHAAFAGARDDDGDLDDIGIAVFLTTFARGLLRPFPWMTEESDA